jgi:hypothetical protein
MSVTTLSGAKTQFLANNLYDVHRSTSEAVLFIEACRALLLLLPKTAKQGRMGGEMTMSPDYIQEALGKAERFYESSSAASGGRGSGTVRALSFEDYRS